MISIKNIPSFSLWSLLASGLAVRLLLIAYSIYHDAHFIVKYTDIDYVVFSDAARFMAIGESPFQRSTYRYTPLLAQMLIPNITLHMAFGKVLFALFDLAIGYLLYAIVSMVLTPPSSSNSARAAASAADLSKQALVYAAVYVLNPFIINVSTRGNADALPSLFVLLCLYCFAKRKWTLSAVAFGVAVHVKIYPIVYALVLYLSIPTRIKDQKHGLRFWMRYMLERDRIMFALVAAGTFIALTAYYYTQFGWVFLYETYLYHLVRSDHRHNFSVYFYQLYLSPASVLSSLAFVPQLALILATSFKYRRDPIFACFLLTLVFVAFNKVCTVQYFVWYLALLPLVLPSMHMKLRTAVSTVGSFVVAMGLWLFAAFLLEFKGAQTFLYVWAAGLAFFAANMAVAVACVRSYVSRPLF
eukprot:ANDGO_07671.mRNA.1 GPI mannosyltransferase 1